MIYSIFVNFKEDKPYILKPNPNYLVKHITESEINFLYIPNYINDFNLYFNNNLTTTLDRIYGIYNYFFLYSKNFDNKINIINDDNYLEHDFFWAVCLNNIPYNENFILSESACLNNRFLENYEKSKIIKSSGFTLIQFSKKKLDF